MEGGVEHNSQIARPTTNRRALGHYVSRPALRITVELDRLGQSEGLPDSPPQLVGDRLQLQVEAIAGDRAGRQRLEAPVTVLPLLARYLDGRGHAGDDTQRVSTRERAPQASRERQLSGQSGSISRAMLSPSS